MRALCVINFLINAAAAAAARVNELNTGWMRAASIVTLHICDIRVIQWDL
jgi:hypothetical protein